MPTFKAIHPTTGEVLDAPSQEWMWIAEYKDGSDLYQFDPKTSTFHYFSEIDQSNLAIFHMVSTEHDYTVAVAFDPSCHKLVHFRLKTLLDIGGDRETQVLQYVFGTETNGHADFMMINPDGSVLHLGDRNPSEFSPELVS